MEDYSDLSAVSILVVDDEEMLAWSIAKELKNYGADVQACTTYEDAVKAFNANPPDLVVSDLKLPDGSGLDLLKKWKVTHPNMPFILMTAHGGMESAITAVKLRAFDYLQKPFQMNDLTSAVSRAAEVSVLRKKIQNIEGQVKPKGKVTIVGDSPAMQDVRRTLKKIADSRTDTVLISGDTGTGKELAARALHDWSDRAHKNFVEINCASIPATLLESELFGHEKGAFTDAKQRKMGLFELAGEGTLFLDELGELPLELQPKLLRVLEQRSFRRVGGTKEIEFRGRIVAATNRELLREVQHQRFRADLYYRLNVIKIELPNLASRRSDIESLAEFFIDKFSRSLQVKKPQIASEAFKKLQAYSWPGNIRELSNVLQRALVLSETNLIGPDDIQLDPIIGDCQTDTLDSTNNFPNSAEGDRKILEINSDQFHIPEEGISLEKLEKNLLVQALERTHHNQSKAAALLNISRHTMRYRLDKHGLL